MTLWQAPNGKFGGFCRYRKEGREYDSKGDDYLGVFFRFDRVKIMLSRQRANRLQFKVEVLQEKAFVSGVIADGRAFAPAINAAEERLINKGARSSPASRVTKSPKKRQGSEGKRQAFGSPALK